MSLLTHAKVKSAWWHLNNTTSMKYQGACALVFSFYTTGCFFFYSAVFQKLMLMSILALQHQKWPFCLIYTKLYKDFYFYLTGKRQAGGYKLQRAKAG